MYAVISTGGKQYRVSEGDVLDVEILAGNVGDTVEFGGLLGSGPVMPVSRYSSETFVGRGGRIPAPIHSLRN